VSYHPVEENYEAHDRNHATSILCSHGVARRSGTHGHSRDQAHDGLDCGFVMSLALVDGMVGKIVLEY
jgi:hypothetical protein